jgi:hypothetical protein
MTAVKVLSSSADVLRTAHSTQHELSVTHNGGKTERGKNKEQKARFPNVCSSRQATRARQKPEVLTAVVARATSSEIKRRVVLFAT